MGKVIVARLTVLDHLDPDGEAVMSTGRNHVARAGLCNPNAERIYTVKITQSFNVLTQVAVDLSTPARLLLLREE